ncbi:MAG: stage 0 sporulation family protein [Chloroflexi bacterium]|nr:stage 0 sporulation family protein [Chloroflexota bacterium]
MSNVVGIRFKKGSKVYYFDPAGIDLGVNDCVIVETTLGQQMGQVAISPKFGLTAEAGQQLKPIVRKAEPEDISHARELEIKEKEALAECVRLVEKFNLPMKPLSAEYDFGGKHVTIYFRAEQRVDFRDLVRELAGNLKVRVELRQTRPRDEARLLGGCGRCGRTLCCASFLSEFAPVSIKMAKMQSLPLNPMKISGACGRLMCCLGYENDLYQEMKAKLPRNGQRVSTASGMGKVVDSNPLKETVLIEIEESGATVELPLNEINVIKPESSPDTVTREN